MLRQGNSLRKKYHIFMREFIDNKYLKDFENIKVLGERFISNYYVVVFHSFTEDEQLEVYIIVENIKNPIIPLDLKVFDNGRGYIITRQNLLKNLPEKLHKKLIKNGIFETFKTVYNKSDSTFGIHRLVLNLYTQCLNQKVHHINFCRHFNAICNLINMIKSKHIKIHRLSRKDATLLALKDQNKLKLKLASAPKNTLAENLTPEILKLRLEI